MTTIDKRYQVFVSSTFADLQNERQEVMQALLELDCIPAGMELFPAANEDQWSLIKKVIDDCDYYLVIIAGRYGSLAADGMGYTEKEYRYALEQKKPIIAFLHKDPSSLSAKVSEKTEEGKEKLDKFREFAQKKLCRFWDSPADLGSQVSRSLIKLIKSTPAVGWVRGDLIPDTSAAEEILRLRKKIETLEAGLESVRVQAPAGTSTLAQGEDKIEIKYSFKAHTAGRSWESAKYQSKTLLSWDQIFSAVSPIMIDEATEGAISEAIDGLIATHERILLGRKEELRDKILSNFDVAEDCFQTIKVQLRALGLIKQSPKARSVKDSRTYWTLTPYGDSIMTRLRAIEKVVPNEDGPRSEDL